MESVHEVAFINVDEDNSTILQYSTQLIGPFIISHTDQTFTVLVQFSRNVDLLELILYASPTPFRNHNASPPKQINIYKIDLDTDINCIVPNKIVICSSTNIERGQSINLQNSKYENAYYYWQSITLLRRLIIIFIAVLLESTFSTLILIFMLCVFVCLEYKCQSFIVLLISTTQCRSNQFNKTRGLALHIVSNQNDTPKTYLTGIAFKSKQMQDMFHEIKANSSLEEQKEDHEIIESKYDTPENKNEVKNALFEPIEKKLQQIDLLYDHIKLKRDLRESAYLLDKDIYAHRSVFDVYAKHENVVCDLNKCQRLKQLCIVMALYHYFIYQNTKSDEKQHEICIDTLELNSVNVLNAFHHLLAEHDHEFETVYKHLMSSSNHDQECTLSCCLLLKRNHRDRAMQIPVRKLYLDHDNAHEIALQQILDKIHCHYFHTFDIGYRLSNEARLKIENKLLTNEEMESLTMHDDASDNIVKEINTQIINKRKTYRNVSGLERIQCDLRKFTTAMPDTDKLQYSYSYRFFYWDFYKQINEKTCDPAQYINNWHKTDANDGYRLHELYIKAKFQNLKHELFFNPICKIRADQWNNVFVKAVQHGKSDHYKRQKCQHYGGKTVYNIEYKQPISVYHLLCMMIYCNEDMLQSRFSATFRKNSVDEPLISIIQRHSNYAHFARGLRECVDCFGSVEDSILSMNYTRQYTVFHGMNIQTQFCSVDVFIKGPVSTSTEFAVAANFANNQGIILQFSFDMWWHIGDSFSGLSLFKCAFLSDYSNESEIFFIGGHSRFVFDTIIIAPTGKNYQIYVSALAAISQLCWTYKLSGVITESLEPAVETMCFRIILNQLHLAYPNSEHYCRFQMPLYAQQLVDNHFKSIERFGVNVGRHYSIKMLWKLMEHYFFYEYGWIRLDVLTKVFPSISHINYKVFEAEKFMSCITVTIANILYWLQQNPKTQLKCIMLFLPRSDEIAERLFQIRWQYYREFHKVSWIIMCGLNRKRDDKYSSDPGIKIEMWYEPTMECGRSLFNTFGALPTLSSDLVASVFKRAQQIQQMRKKKSLLK